MLMNILGFADFQAPPGTGRRLVARRFPVNRVRQDDVFCVNLVARGRGGSPPFWGAFIRCIRLGNLALSLS
jgi:hypothetical protein